MREIEDITLEKTSGDLWRGLKRKEIQSIIAGAGEKVHYCLDRYFPFIHREVWEFGGNCGLCGNWNWQWVVKGTFRWTVPCGKCLKEYLE